MAPGADVDPATAPFFRDLDEEAHAGLRGLLQRARFDPGEILWQQGAAADGAHVIERGTVEVSRRLPDGDSQSLATAGAGEILGELGLFGEGRRSGEARAVDKVATVFLSRDAVNMLASHPSTAITSLRRRCCHVGAARLRRRHAALAETLPAGDQPHPPLATPSVIDLSAAAWDSYVPKLSFFADWGPDELESLRARARIVSVPRQTWLYRRGDLPASCHVVVNGVLVERIERGPKAVKTGVVGPGRASGYVGIVLGSEHSVAAVAYERAVLMELQTEVFAELYDGRNQVSRRFVESFHRDVMVAVRQAERPHITVAAGVE